MMRIASQELLNVSVVIQTHGLYPNMTDGFERAGHRGGNNLNIHCALSTEFEMKLEITFKGPMS
eukprot:1776656-Pleurochrysis_carterae.AAC.2